MRAIVNIASASVAAAAGWRARPIHVDESGATLEDILRSATLKQEGHTLYDLLAREDGLKPEFALYVNGRLLRGQFDWRKPVLHSEQIHVYDWPLRDN